MAGLFVAIAACVAAAWLGVSVLYGVRCMEEAHLHAHYEKCPSCRHRHFVGRTAGSAHHR